MSHDGGRSPSEESHEAQRSVHFVEMQICPSCGEENPPRFRLCGYCGAALAPALPAHEERKVVTVFFSDLKGSTSLGETLDPESLREVMTSYFDAMTAVLRRHGGTIEKFIGDAIMAVFGLPRLHEDDALRAVRAAAETRAALAALNVDLEARYGVRLTNRTGVNTGEVVAGDPTTGQRLVTGDTVNVAARLEQAAPADEVLIGPLTYQLVRDAVRVEAVEPLELKGKAERVPAYRLIAALAPDEAAAVPETAIVGRDDELARLNVLHDRAVDEARCWAATVVGDAGVGKSRLVTEFTGQHADGDTVLKGRCLPYGDGITFWPLLEITRAAAGIEPDDTTQDALGRIEALTGDREVAARLAAAIGLSEEHYALTELFWAARRLLEIVAAERPALVIFDDIHWAEATFLELVEYLTETVTAPILLLCTARHELLEKREAWATGARAARIELAPLSDLDTVRVIENLLGDVGLASGVRLRIVEAAEGNPLFVEQLLSMLIDTGAMARVDGRWEMTRDGASISVPPTIQALMAARLDHLSREERAVIEPAAVIGQEFPYAAVSELSPEAVRAEVRSLLTSTARKQLVHPMADGSAEADAYRFHHILIRDAAYGSLLKRARATLHERFVDWAEGVNAELDRGTEFEEIHGYHLEQAYRYLAELGPLDEHGRALGRRAAERLSSAGRRAFGRGDMPAARSLLERAAGTLPANAPARLPILADLGEALMELGQFAEANAVLVDAEESAQAMADDLRRADATLVRLMVELYAGGQEWSASASAQVDQAIRIYEAAGDHAGLARAWRLHWAVHGTANRLGESAAAAERVLEEARLANDRRLEARGAYGYAIAALYGPVPVPDAIERCEELAASITGDRRTEALIRGALAQLYAMRGETDRGRQLSAEVRSMLQELGAGVLASANSIDSSRIELLAGDLVAAEQQLRADYDALALLGERFLLSTVAGSLARVVYQLDRFEEAEELALLVEQLASSDDVDAQALWRSVLGMCLARRGKTADGVRVATEAVELRRSTDALVLLAEALTDLAEVHRFTGDDFAVRQLRSEALDLYERKGDLVSAGRLRALLSG